MFILSHVVGFFQPLFALGFPGLFSGLVG